MPIATFNVRRRGPGLHRAKNAKSTAITEAPAGIKGGKIFAHDWTEFEFRGNNAAAADVVCTVTIAFGLPGPLTVNRAGEIVHCAPGGTPVHDSGTGRLNPFRGLSVKE